MKKNILVFVHTEYHLLLAINQILRLYSDPETFKTDVFINRGGRTQRIREDLDLSGLPLTAHYFDALISLKQDPGSQERESISELIELDPDIFIFFQEQDPLMSILANAFHAKGKEVHLYQDGLKPYTHLKYHSISLIRGAYKQNNWLKRNGFMGNGWRALWYSKKFAHLNSISKVCLTFPESYNNWNRKPLEKIEFLPSEILSKTLDKVYRWTDDELKESSNVILYMNQPMHDDGKAETEFLKALRAKFPKMPIYIKLHPLTHNNQKIELYKQVPNLRLIYSLIPAELYILHLKESIILSINSTSMFLNNPNCRYFYIYEIFKPVIKRLQRIVIKRTPAIHIKTVKTINEIF